MAQETRKLSHDPPPIVSKVGVVVSTNDRHVVWVLRPTEPVLVRGDEVPTVLYGDVVCVIFDGVPQFNNMTYARLDGGRGELTTRSEAFDG